jgi:hypothetical protein
VLAAAERARIGPVEHGKGTADEDEDDDEDESRHASIVPVLIY